MLGVPDRDVERSWWYYFETMGIRPKDFVKRPDDILALNISRDRCKNISPWTQESYWFCVRWILVFCFLSQSSFLFLLLLLLLLFLVLVLLVLVLVLFLLFLFLVLLLLRRLLLLFLLIILLLLFFLSFIFSFHLVLPFIRPFQACQVHIVLSTLLCPSQQFPFLHIGIKVSVSLLASDARVSIYSLLRTHAHALTKHTHSYTHKLAIATLLGLIPLCSF